MKIRRDFQQRSVEWMIARAGIPTASEFDNIFTSTFKLRDGEMIKTYACKKAAEKWIGGGLPGFNTFDMDQGNILENEAIPWLEAALEKRIERIGLLTDDAGLMACSPDGLIDETQGVEVKCPAIHTHVRYLVSGILPQEYAAQVHGSLFISGFQSWRFFSHCRNFPPLMLVIERQQDIMEKIEEGMADFTALLNNYYDRLVELNGGPPRRLSRKPQPKPELVTDDVAH